MHSDGIAALLEAAGAVYEAGEHHKALELWRQYRQQRPTDADGYLKAAVALRRAGRFASADALLKEGLAQSASRLPLAIEYAWVAHYQSNWTEALSRWQSVAQSYPKHPAGITGIGRVLIKLTQLAEAEQSLAAGVSAFPSDIHLATTFAEVASAREHWKDALNRWNKVLHLKPDDESAIAQREVARSHIGESAAEASISVEVPPLASGSPSVAPPAIGSVIRQYESLGDNSEFGFVQRHFKAEPAGLLSWTYCVVDSVIKVLEQQFSDFGRLSNLTLFRTSWKEYMVREIKYGITFPTFFADDNADKSAILSDQSIRLSRLAERLLSDLTYGNKRFIFKISHSTSDGQIQRLHSLVQQYSARNTLLCVSVSSDVTECGAAENLGNGLFLGKLSRRSPIGARRDIPYDEWRAVLEGAAAFGGAFNSMDASAIR
jgi:tetratricopeptide (TPR) repeat protein